MYKCRCVDMNSIWIWIVVWSDGTGSSNDCAELTWWFVCSFLVPRRSLSLKGEEVSYLKYFLFYAFQICFIFLFCIPIFHISYPSKHLNTHWFTNIRNVLYINTVGFPQMLLFSLHLPPSLTLPSSSSPPVSLKVYIHA